MSEFVPQVPAGRLRLFMARHGAMQLPASSALQKGCEAAYLSLQTSASSYKIVLRNTTTMISSDNFRSNHRHLASPYEN